MTAIFRSHSRISPTSSSAGRRSFFWSGRLNPLAVSKPVRPVSRCLLSSSFAIGPRRTGYGLLALARILFPLLALLAGPWPLFGAEGPGDEDAELYDLLDLLDDQTQLATKSGMNADFIPGMVTILHGDDLLARGARTVWESLSLVPGISQNLEVTGEREVLSRGVGHGYSSGNIKILLDGVSMNSALLGTANSVLNIPIEQVKRIEVIRGPGSSVYGEYAYAGVVDIITHRRERTLHAQAGGSTDYGGGLVWNWENAERDLSFAINLAGNGGDGGGNAALEKDALYSIGRPELSNAPGPTNEDHRYRGLFADLQWKDYFASFALLDDSYGDHFGINHFLPPKDNGLASSQSNLSLQLGRETQFSDRLSAGLRLEWMQHEHERSHLYVFPADYIGNTQPVSMDRDYRETRYLAALDVHWQPTRNHRFLLGLEASQTEIDEATWDWYGLSDPIPESWLDTDHRRRIYSLFAQDEYRASDHLTVTGTLRYDDYSDVDSFFSPRLAAVWRIDDQNILKAQYALAFRPPTFYETEYPARGFLKTSEISTFELGYIVKRLDWDARLTAFRSNLTRPIIFDEDSNDGYINAPDERLTGIELEYRHHFDRNFKIDANLSYVDTERLSTGDPLPGGANLLGNLALLWKPATNWTTALQLRYVGDRHRAPKDSRPPLQSYTLVDFTLSFSSSGREPFFYAGIKNLTNEDVRYPDQLTSLLGLTLVDPDDYPRQGRHYWLSLGLSF